MSGVLFDNVVAFGRLLRSGGIGVGPTQIVEGVRALELTGVRSKSDFYWALAGSLVTKPEQRVVFDQAFQLFWRGPTTERTIAEIERLRRSDDDSSGDEQPDESSPAVSIIGDEVASGEAQDGEHRSADQRDSASDAEVLLDKHFDQMDQAELAAAKRAIRSFNLSLEPMVTRRRRRDPNGPMLDWRRSLRAMQRGGGAMAEFAYSSRREELPAIVLLCDISGSMQLYSRLLVYFACALGAQRRNTHAFLFGTQLTNVSRMLGSRDIDAGVNAVCGATRDFDGGTRIGPAIAEFNKHWSRRLLARKSLVVLMTDGLEGEDADQLERAIARLHRSASRLIWLNPLLRFAGFEPKADGVRAIMKHVDSVHGVHTLRHVSDVVAALRVA